MKILHIETSSKNCSVAVSQDSQLICLCEEISENYKQSENLHTFVQWALEGAEITLQEIDAISLGKGPGSYTGLRIGAAAAKGFCFALEIPLVAVNSLQTMITPFINQGFDLVIPLIDAKRQEVYCADFDGFTGEMISETQAKILDENSFKEQQSKKILFVGDGAKKAQEIISLPDAEFRPDTFPSAQYLLQPALEKLQNQQYENVAYFEPFYLKDFFIQKKG